MNKRARQLRRHVQTPATKENNRIKKRYERRMDGRSPLNRLTNRPVPLAAALFIVLYFLICGCLFFGCGYDFSLFVKPCQNSAYTVIIFVFACIKMFLRYVTRNKFKKYCEQRLRILSFGYIMFMHAINTPQFQSIAFCGINRR